MPVAQYVDRGFGRTLVCIPGFAFDGRIFAGLNLPLDYLLLDSASGVQDLIRALREHELLPRELYLLGWSLGAATALRWSRELSAVQRVWLVSLRPSFPPAEIAQQRAALAADPEAYLRDFYRRAFAGQLADRRAFEATLLDEYLRRFSADKLAGGLDALAALDVQPEQVDAANATLIHGRRDLIAPLSEIESFAARCGNVRLEVLSGAGHVPFASPRFCETILRDLEC